MRMRLSTSEILALSLLVLCSTAYGQSLRIGAANGARGQTVVVPVTLTATTSHTAALVRVQYDAAVLENVAATSGAMMSNGHALAFNGPTAGRFDVAVYAPTGMPSFKSKSGTLFNLTFRVKPNAQSGTSPITFTTVGTPILPAADLVGITGGAVTPTATAGSVSIPTTADNSWLRYP